MTNMEFLQSCTEFELADTLTEMIINVVETLTHEKVSEMHRLGELETMVDFLESEFIEPLDEYIN